MIIIRKRDPETRQARYHLLTLQGAFDLTQKSISDGSLDCDVVHEWGRIGSPGTVRAQRYNDEKAAREAALAYELLKRRKGYR